MEDCPVQRRLLRIMRKIVDVGLKFYCIGRGKGFLHKIFPYVVAVVGLSFGSKSLYYSLVCRRDDVNEVSRGVSVALAIQAMGGKVYTWCDWYLHFFFFAKKREKSNRCARLLCQLCLAAAKRETLERQLQLLNRAFDEELRNLAYRDILLRGFGWYFVPVFVMLGVITFFNFIHAISPLISLLVQVISPSEEPLKYSMAPHHSIWNEQVENDGRYFLAEYSHLVLACFVVNTCGIWLDAVYVYYSVMIVRSTQLLAAKIREFDFAQVNLMPRSWASWRQ